MTVLQTISIHTLCVGLALAPMPVLAAPAEAKPKATDADEAPDETAQAMAAYQRGIELYAAAEWEAALAAFQEAATLYASPDFQFNIAKCYERLGEYQEAIRHYEVYLRTSDDTSDRAVIEASIADLEQRIADQEAAAAAAAAAAAEPEPEPEPETNTHPGRALIVTGGVLLGVGVGVGLGGGLAFGLPVARDNATLGEVLDGNPDGLTFAEADAIAASAKQNQTLEVVMIGVGGAVAVAGVALLAVGLVKKKAASGVSSSLQVAPTWTRTGGGVMLRGSF